MFLRGSKSWQRPWIALAAGVLMLFVSSLAFAAGRIEWGSKKIKPRSDGNSWNVEIKIYLPNPPDVPSVPTKFIFLQKVYYERSMVDGDKLVVRNVPMEGKLPVVESVDIGFLDPRSGKIEKRTQFSFKLHRDHGFDCGEYKVTVRDARNDSVIGQPVNIILDGENEVIDRRSIVFSGEKKKKVDSTGGAKQEEEKKSEDAEPKKEAEPAPEPEPASDVDSPSDEDSYDSAESGKLKKKPGGCGCRVPGHSGNSPASLGWFALATTLLFGRRFRRRRATT